LKALEKDSELRCPERADLKRWKRDTEQGRSASGARLPMGHREAAITEHQLTASFASVVLEAAISPDGNSRWCPWCSLQRLIKDKCERKVMGGTMYRANKEEPAGSWR
jgi:hypothetical protein